MPVHGAAALARRWLPKAWSWPRPLRNKWAAVVLLGLFLWAYEAFSLWDSPWWTAWIAVGYFVAAFVVDGLFRGAAFCKYLCPIGQFNFVQSLASPLEVRVRDPGVCAACRTKDCIRGRDGVPGCEMHLFQPRKVGNMDCTFCLDCVHACPHDNVGVSAGAPLSGLSRDPARSGVGRFGSRPDLAALVLVLAFGAFANAAGMVGPVQEWQGRLSSLLGQRSPCSAVSLFYGVVLVVLPVGVGRRRGRPEPRVGAGPGELAGDGDPLLLRPRASGARHVGRPLQLPLPDQLRRGRPRDAATSCSTWGGRGSDSRTGSPPAVAASPTGCPGWRSFSSTSACCSRSTWLTASPSRQTPRAGASAEGLRAVGRPDGRPVRGGRVDRPSAHADAGRVLNAASTK